MTVGILGGTFDPVHLGHIEAARQLRTAAELDEVWLMPNAQPPHRAKPPAASADDRLAMVRLAVAGETGLAACDAEVRRGGRSYTVDSLEQLRDEHPDRRFALLLGYDVARGIQSWHDAGRLLAETTMIVFNRSTAQAPEGSALRRLGFDADRTRIVTIESPPISAHEIRDRLSRGEPIETLVPAGVADYIRQHRLYDGCVG